MKLKLTKKGKIVIFVILGIIVLGSGGFLLWRVLQDDTVAPEDSDAGGPGSCCCVRSSCPPQCNYSCPSGTICKSNSDLDNPGQCKGEGCGVCQKVYQGCYWSNEMGNKGDSYYGCDGKYFTIDANSGLCYCGGTHNGLSCWKKDNQCKCANTCDPGPEITCTKTKQCEFPLNAYYNGSTGQCDCIRWDQQPNTYGTGSYCAAKPQQCSFSTTCVAKGMIDCGVSGDGKDKSGCSA
jgi:hypothetical protein